MDEKEISGEFVVESSKTVTNTKESTSNFQIPSVFYKQPESLSMSVVPMKALLTTYKKRRVGLSCDKMIETSDDCRNDKSVNNEHNSFKIPEEQSQIRFDVKKQIQTNLPNDHSCGEVESWCKRLEEIVSGQSEIISSMRKELLEINKWKRDQMRLQATKTIQTFWRNSKSRRSDSKLEDKSLTCGKKEYFIEQFKELNNEVTLLKTVLKNLLEYSMKEGNISISLPQETSYNSTNAGLEFITDLRATVQSDTSLLLAWTQYRSPSTVGFSICINGHQVGTVSTEKTKALLEGLIPSAFYKITLVEQISTDNPRESNPVFVCINSMKPSLLQEHTTPDSTKNESCISSEDRDGTKCSEQLAENSFVTESNDAIPQSEFTAVAHSGETIASEDSIVSHPVPLSTETTSSGAYAGEKRELNRTYELERKLTEIRRMITEADIESTDDAVVD